jgi:hypothetical protein
MAKNRSGGSGNRDNGSRGKSKDKARSKAREAKDSVQAAEPERPAKLKLVRDSFTIPKPEHRRIGELKKRCLQAGLSVKKSELLRAGLLALSEMDAGALESLLDRVEKIKTGRPKK